MRFPLFAACAFVLFATSADPSLAENDFPVSSCTAALDGYTLHLFVPPEAKGAPARQLRAVVRRAVTWAPGQTIKVCFTSGTDKAQERVAAYAREWMQHANIILDFGEAGSLRKCEGDASEDIKIDFAEGKGFWSALGIQSRRINPSMNLEYLGGVPSTKLGLPMSEAHVRGVILHEFGHALGMLHEHQNPSAACDTEFDWEKAYEITARWGWGREKTDRWFRQMVHTDELNMTDIDRKSIMHYALPPEVFKLGKQSRCWVPYNFELSLQDRAFIRTVYPKKDDTVVSDLPMSSSTRGSASGARDSADKEALIKEYESLLRQAGVVSEKVAPLSETFRKLVVGQ